MYETIKNLLNIIEQSNAEIVEIKENLAYQKSKNVAFNEIPSNERIAELQGLVTGFTALVETHKNALTQEEINELFGVPESDNYNI